MSTPVANAIARMQARAAPPVDAPGRSMEESEILQMRRMLDAQEDVFYYLTVTNENYRMPAMPKGAEQVAAVVAEEVKEAIEKPAAAKKSAGKPAPKKTAPSRAKTAKKTGREKR